MALPFRRAGARSALRHFLDSEAAGGLLLMGAAALALIVANSGLAEAYHDMLHAEIGPELTPKLGPMTVHLWINDGLMAIFFLLVGLEIKREFLDGQLSTWDRRRLPVIAAAVGMVVPAFFYLGLTSSVSGLARGWAIPAATDIAFAIGVLALLGSRAPTSLKLFLTTVAIADDLGAVAVIALAYTDSLDSLALGASAFILFTMYAIGKSGVQRLWVYLILAVLLWYAVLLSGVHATVAGVLAASTIPVVRTPGAPDSAESPLHRLEHGIAPWVAFLIVPLFGFANAGVSLQGIGLAEIFAPLPLGIAAGLFLGKQVGIFGAVLLAEKLNISPRPGGISWMQTWGIATLCGIGFTMSLFIATLSYFGNDELYNEAKIGVLSGTLVSLILGYVILRFAAPNPASPQAEAR